MKDELFAAVPKPGERPTADLVADLRYNADQPDSMADKTALLREAADRLESLTTDLEYAQATVRQLQKALDGKYWERKHGGAT